MLSRRDKDGAALLNVAGDVVEIEQGEHTAPVIAVENDEIEILQFVRKQFACRKGDERELIYRSAVILFRWAQNREMHEIDRCVGFQQITPYPFAGVWFARNQQHA